MIRSTLKRTRAFYGWRIVALASITGALTGPGQTIGVSVFVDHFIADLGLSRSQVSTAYLIGTLLAAGGLPYVGRRIDQAGVRKAMTGIALAFGLALVAMSGVQGFLLLTVGFVAIRLFGQGSLSLVSTVSVTLWFDKRRGTALGIYNTTQSILMSLVPVGLSFVIAGWGWRPAWIIAAFVVVAVVVPIARLGLIDRPSDVGQLPDGLDLRLQGEEPKRAARSLTRGEALRTFPFWSLAAASASVGMLSTALNFHQISLLGDTGLTATEAAAMFLPQVIGAALAGVFFGYLADRLTGRVLIPMAMALLTISLLLASVLTPGLLIVVYAISLGAAGGAARSVASTLLPRWFGVDHIGSIQGTAIFLTVASTALGPLAFSLARDAAGDFSGAARWFALVPAIAGLVATFIRPGRQS
jgi:MFS family permease